jgi:diacylglycerol kinase (ATP)
MKLRALVVLNPHARQGRARELWPRVRTRVEEHFVVELVETDRDAAWEARLAGALCDGIRVFIAAGGDGTVHALVNALVRQAGGIPLGELCLGAVGLGSSNDFHKPFSRVEDGIPLRIRPPGAGEPALRDVVLARTWTGERSEARHFVVSASLGLTAEANAFFNGTGPVIGRLKRCWTGGAILYSAFRALLRGRVLPATLVFPDSGQRYSTGLTALSVMKTPHLSGSFLFDTPVERGNGQLAVNLCERMTRLQILGVLVDLARGRFLGGRAEHRGRRHWDVRRLRIELDRAAPLELDGEVTRVERVEFEILKDQIGECL